MICSLGLSVKPLSTNAVTSVAFFILKLHGTDLNIKLQFIYYKRIKKKKKHCDLREPELCPQVLWECVISQWQSEDCDKLVESSVNATH